MAHAAKYARAGAGHLSAHYERRKEKDPLTGEYEYIKFGNQDIDPSRTHLNYNLAPEREGGQMAFLKQRLSEVKCLNRADVKVMCSWVITLPEFENMRTDIHVTPNEEAVSKLFFERCYQFLAARYGEENIISSYVHRDETTDHMHCAFVPVMQDPKTGEEKVCAKKVLSRTELQRFHGDLERHLDSFGDWHFKILNDATKEGNKSIDELKRGAAQEELQLQQQAAAGQIEKLQHQMAQAEAGAKRRKDALDAEIAALEQKRDGILTATEVADLEGRRALGGGLKGVTYTEYEALKRTAAKVDEMAAALDQANARVEAVDQIIAEKAAAIQAYANQQLDAKVADLNAQLTALRAKDQDEIRGMKWELTQLRSENHNLKVKVGRLEKIIDFLKEVIREKLPQLVKAVEDRSKQILNPSKARER